MFPVGTICGNTYIMKPSERDPTACMVLVDMLKEAGMPDGVVNVIHGSHDAVNFICDHPDIKAISFVGKSSEFVGSMEEFSIWSIIVFLRVKLKIGFWKVTKIKKTNFKMFLNFLYCAPFYLEPIS